MGWTNSTGWSTGAGGWNTAAAASGSPVLFTYDFIATPSLPATLSLSRATVGTYFDSSGVMSSAAINVARFQYIYNGTSFVKAGLLVEEQRTNGVVADDISNNAIWTPLNNSVGTAVTGIDGTSNAHKITRNAGLAHGLVYTPGNIVTTASPVTYSAYVKASGYSNFALREGNAGSGVGLNFSGAGSVMGLYSAGSYTASGGSVANLGNGFYQVGALWTPSGSQNFNIGLVVLDNVWTGASGDPFLYDWTADGTSGVIVSGLQGEIGSFPTSYIYAAGAATTRSADIVSATGALATQLAAGPSVWEMQDQATGTISRTSYAAGTFNFPTSKLYRSFGVYPSGTNTTPYLTVGGSY